MVALVLSPRRMQVKMILVGCCHARRLGRCSRVELSYILLPRRASGVELSYIVLSRRDPRIDLAYVQAIPRDSQ